MGFEFYPSSARLSKDINGARTGNGAGALLLQQRKRIN